MTAMPTVNSAMFVTVSLLASVFCACAAPVADGNEVVAAEQALVRTSNCLANGAPRGFSASPPVWPADATASIQATIDQAKGLAATIAGTCTVQARIPAGTWRIDGTLFVPGRVHLLGADKSSTKLVKVYNAAAQSAIDLRDRSLSGCPQLSHIRVQHLSIEMRDSVSSTAPPALGSGHCIRSGTGVSDFELRNLKLTRCRFYGIGLQITAGCMDAGSPYENFTINGVRLHWAGSDGIDMKSTAHSQNANGELVNLCFTDIGQRGDGNWEAAFDLAGDNLWVSSVQAINGTLVSQTSGIDLGAAGRRVTNSLVENFYVKRYAFGLTAGSAVENITVRNGALKLNTVGANLAAGTIDIDTAGTNVCGSGNARPLTNAGTGNDWSWGTCPITSVPACSD
jgi:hypothetical protein